MNTQKPAPIWGTGSAGPFVCSSGWASAPARHGYLARIAPSRPEAGRPPGRNSALAGSGTRVTLPVTGRSAPLVLPSGRSIPNDCAPLPTTAPGRGCRASSGRCPCRQCRGLPGRTRAVEPREQTMKNGRAKRDRLMIVTRMRLDRAGCQAARLRRRSADNPPRPPRPPRSSSALAGSGTAEIATWIPGPEPVPFTGLASPVNSNPIV